MALTSEKFCRKWSRYLSLMSWIFQQCLPGANELTGCQGYLHIKWPQWLPWICSGIYSGRRMAREAVGYIYNKISPLKVWFCMFTISSLDSSLSLQWCHMTIIESKKLAILLFVQPLVQCTSKEISKFYVTGLCKASDIELKCKTWETGMHQGPVDSPHKGPVM